MRATEPAWDFWPRNNANPAHEPLAVLEKLRAEMGSDIFAAQYQQSPVPPGGAMIRDFWLTNVAQERGERSCQWKKDGVKALSEYADKEQAIRILTVKLRAERFAREAKSTKRNQKKAAKA